MNHPSDGRHVAIEDSVEQGLAAGLAVSGNHFAVKIGYNQVLLLAVNEGDAAGLYHHQIFARNPGTQVPAAAGLNPSTVGPRGRLD